MIDWNCFRKRRASKTNGNVRIRLYKTKNAEKGRQLSIRFFDGAETFVTKSGYMCVGKDIDRKRIYFCEGDHLSGHKVTGEPNREIKFIANPDSYQYWEFIQGDYNLEKDEKEGLYYIATGAKGDA